MILFYSHLKYVWKYVKNTYIHCASKHEGAQSVEHCVNKSLKQEICLLYGKWNKLSTAV